VILRNSYVCSQSNCGQLPSCFAWDRRGLQKAPRRETYILLGSLFMKSSHDRDRFTCTTWISHREVSSDQHMARKVCGVYQSWTLLLFLCYYSIRCSSVVLPLVNVLIRVHFICLGCALQPTVSLWLLIKVQLQFLLNLGTRWGWVVSIMLQPLYPW
jgi:hypothetical protein